MIDYIFFLFFKVFVLSFSMRLTRLFTKGNKGVNIPKRIIENVNLMFINVKYTIHIRIDEYEFITELKWLIG